MSHVGLYFNTCYYLYSITNSKIISEMLDSVSQEVSDGLEHCTAVHKPHAALVFA